MNPLLFFGGAFVLAVIVAALISGFSESSSRSQSEKEKQRKRDAAMRSAERNRKTMQWVASIGLCIPVITALISWFTPDPVSKKIGLYLAGALTLPFLALWGKTRDDGLNPSLRKKKPNQAPEPTAPSGRGSS